MKIDVNMNGCSMRSLRALPSSELIIVGQDSSDVLKSRQEAKPQTVQKEG